MFKEWAAHHQREAAKFARWGMIYRERGELSRAIAYQSAACDSARAARMAMGIDL